MASYLEHVNELRKEFLELNFVHVSREELTSRRPCQPRFGSGSNRHQYHTTRSCSLASSIEASSRRPSANARSKRDMDCPHHRIHPTRQAPSLTKRKRDDSKPKPPDSRSSELISTKGHYPDPTCSASTTKKHTTSWTSFTKGNAGTIPDPEVWQTKPSLTDITGPRWEQIPRNTLKNVISAKYLQR